MCVCELYNQVDLGDRPKDDKVGNVLLNGATFTIIMDYIHNQTFLKLLNLMSIHDNMEFKEFRYAKWAHSFVRNVYSQLWCEHYGTTAHFGLILQKSSINYDEIK